MIDKILLEEIDRETNNRKNRRVVSVSGIGLCQKRQVALALDLTSNNCSWFYSEAGYALQDRVYMRLKRLYPDTIQEVKVPTIIEGRYCHPDIYIPSLKHAIQVKSGNSESSSWKKVKDYHVKQTMLEWAFWKLAGYYHDGECEPYKHGVPETYEILYVDRATYGEKMFCKELEYDEEMAKTLIERFLETDAYIMSEILPEPLEKPSFECYDFRGKRPNCGLYYQCFGGGD